MLNVEHGFRVSYGFYSTDLVGVTKDPDTTGSEAVCLGFNSGFRVRFLVEVPSAIRIHGPGSEGLEIGGSFQKASPTDMTEDS